MSIINPFVFSRSFQILVRYCLLREPLLIYAMSLVISLKQVSATRYLLYISIFFVENVFNVLFSGLLFLINSILIIESFVLKRLRAISLNLVE
jgi:hypothetical protein